MKTKEIVSPSFGACIADVLEAGKEGYEIDPNNYPVAGFLYQVWLVKEDSDEVAGLKAEAFPAAGSGAPKRGRPFKNAPAAQ